MDDKKIEFVPSGRGKARCAPDPAYPNGKKIECPYAEGKSCLVKLPYPAPECGYWLVSCRDCGCQVAVTAAGRPDDPVSFYMPCQEEKNAAMVSKLVARSSTVN